MSCKVFARLPQQVQDALHARLFKRDQHQD
jgi:hypothetical protein